MAAELGPDGIRVNCVNPVIGATGLVTEFMGMPDTPENRKKFLATIPLGRFSTPDDVASACSISRPMRRASSPAHAWRSTAVAACRYGHRSVRSGSASGRAPNSAALKASYRDRGGCPED